MAELDEQMKDLNLERPYVPIGENPKDYGYTPSAPEKQTAGSLFKEEMGELGEQFFDFDENKPGMDIYWQDEYKKEHPVLAALGRTMTGIPDVALRALGYGIYGLPTAVAYGPAHQVFKYIENTSPKTFKILEEATGSGGATNMAERFSKESKGMADFLVLTYGINPTGAFYTTTSKATATKKITDAQNQIALQNKTKAVTAMNKINQRLEASRPTIFAMKKEGNIFDNALVKLDTKKQVLRSKNSEGFYPNDVKFLNLDKLSEKEKQIKIALGEHLSQGEKRYVTLWRNEEGLTKIHTPTKEFDLENKVSTGKFLTRNKAEESRYFELPDDATAAATVTAELGTVTKGLIKSRRLRQPINKEQFHALLRIWDKSEANSITKGHKRLAAQLDNIKDAKIVTRSSKSTDGLLAEGNEFSGYTSVKKIINTKNIESSDPTSLQISLLKAGSNSPGIPFNPYYAKEYMKNTYSHKSVHRGQISGKRIADDKYENLVRNVDEISIHNPESTLAVFNWGAHTEQGVYKAAENLGLVKEMVAQIVRPGQPATKISLGFYKTPQWNIYLNKHVRGKEPKPLFSNIKGTVGPQKEKGSLKGFRYRKPLEMAKIGKTDVEIQASMRHQQLSTTQGYIKRSPEKAVTDPQLNSIIKKASVLSKTNEYEAFKKILIARIAWRTGLRPTEILDIPIKAFKENYTVLDPRVYKQRGKATSIPFGAVKLSEKETNLIKEYLVVKHNKFGEPAAQSHPFFSKNKNINKAETKQDWQNFVADIPEMQVSKIESKTALIEKSKDIKKIQKESLIERDYKDSIARGKIKIEGKEEIEGVTGKRKLIKEQKAEKVATKIVTQDDKNLERVLGQLELYAKDKKLTGKMREITGPSGRIYRINVGAEVALPSPANPEILIKYHVYGKGRPAPKQVKHKGFYVREYGRGYFFRKSLK